MTTDTVRHNSTERGLRALCLSALLVFSVVVAPVTLSGLGAAANDAGNASVSVQTPTDRTVVQSDDTLDVAYTDTGDVPDRLDVTLDADDGEHSYVYTVAASQYVNDGELVSVTVDLDDAADTLPDDQYTVNVTATDATGDTRSDETEAVVIVDDTAPKVTFEALNRTDDLAAGDDVNVTFTLADASNVTSAAVAFRQAGSSAATVDLGSFTPGEDGTEYTRTVTVPDSLADNTDYQVAVTATDERGQTGEATSQPTILDVNAERPTVTSVEGDVNASTIYLKFSESVVAADGTFDATEFDYVDTNGDGADSITDVEQTAPSEVALTLNETLTAAELDTDAVSVASLSVVDTDALTGDDDGRYVPATTTTITDETAPPVSAFPLPISLANVDSYAVEIGTTDEPTDVTLEAVGPNGTSVSNATTDVTGTTTLTVNTSDLDDGLVTVFANATDPAGNEGVSETVVSRDTVRPTVVEARGSVGATSLQLTFSESVSVDASAVSVDAAGVSVQSVSADGLTATVTLTEALPASALDDTPATVTVSAPGADRVGNTFADEQQSLTAGNLVDLRASADGDAVTVTVATKNDIDSVVGDGVDVVEQNRELVSADSFTLDSRFTTTLTAEDFTETTTNVYEATVRVDDDDEYTVAGVGRTETVVVDTSDPTVVDAAVVGVSSDAQLDQSRNTTRLRVLFDEPVQAGAISPSHISIDGFDGDIVAVQTAGAFGAVEVVVEGHVQTADDPTVGVAGGTYADEAGTIGLGVSTTLHTDVLELSEGTNFVSVPAASGGLSVEELPTESVDAIFTYNAATQSFESYDPDAPENDFTTLEGGQGYIVEMDTDATVAINVPSVPSGQAPPNAQQLHEGYNLVGHYQEDDQSVPVALSSVFAGESGTFSDTVFRLLRQDEGSDGYVYDSYRAGEFAVMERGEAYWVFVSDDQVYTGAPFGSEGPRLVNLNESE